MEIIINVPKYDKKITLYGEFNVYTSRIKRHIVDNVDSESDSIKDIILAADITDFIVNKLLVAKIESPDYPKVTYKVIKYDVFFNDLSITNYILDKGMLINAIIGCEDKLTSKFVSLCDEMGLKRFIFKPLERCATWEYSHNAKNILRELEVENLYYLYENLKS